MTTPVIVEANPAASPPGLRKALHVLLEHAGDHLNLLRLETAQELSRLGTLIGCWFALALFVQLGLIFGLTVLIATLWDTAYRTHAILLSAAALVAGAGYCIWQLQQVSARAAARFTASSQQWQRDVALIRELI